MCKANYNTVIWCSIFATLEAQQLMKDKKCKMEKRFRAA